METMKQIKLKKGDKIAINNNYLLIKRKRLKLKQHIKDELFYILNVILMAFLMFAWLLLLYLAI